MHDYIIYTPQCTQALHYCVQILSQSGFKVASDPDNCVTHLLLPVPSFNPDSTIIGGGNLLSLLSSLPKDIVVVGGNLNLPELDGYTTVDILQDPIYLAKNAQITAYCAIKLAMNQLPIILSDCNVLIIGWGRIGKCLSQILQNLGAQVTVCARNASDRGIASALGCKTIEISKVSLSNYRLIFNTVPFMLFPECPGNALKIDLASKKGLGSEDVIWARGLPGKDAPESSGRLIAETLQRILRKDSL